MIPFCACTWVALLLEQINASMKSYLLNQQHPKKCIFDFVCPLCLDEIPSAPSRYKTNMVIKVKVYFTRSDISTVGMIVCHCFYVWLSHIYFLKLLIILERLYCVWNVKMEKHRPILAILVDEFYGIYHNRTSGFL